LIARTDALPCRNALQVQSRSVKRGLARVSIKQSKVDNIEKHVGLVGYHFALVRKIDYIEASLLLAHLALPPALLLVREEHLNARALRGIVFFRFL